VRFQRASTGEVVALDESHKLGAGGEARIFIWPRDDSLVAKIWHKPTPERNRKLRVMHANPPSDPMTGQSHHSIAWPSDLLHLPGRSDYLVGFLMPRVVGLRPIGEFSHPRTRREKCPLFNSFYLHRTARNLATALRALHERGYVVGDLNESNVLVAETALVTVVDTDSFQVWDAEAGQMYRCRVGKPEYTPPELQGKRFPDVDRTPEHDLFGLGVLLFQLLMEGTHPFAGVFKGRGEPPMLEQRIAAGHFTFAGDLRVPYDPAPAAPPYQLLFPGLRDLFQRCFLDGHFRPSLRPDPQSWQWMLEEAESHLVSCWANAQHVYGDHLPQCPWCSRTRLLAGRDPFPSAEAVKAGDHLRPPPRPAPSLPGATRPTPRSRTPVPMPPPIPPSGSKPWTRFQRAAGRPRPLLGDWNDWAWVAAVFAALTILSAFSFNWRENPVSFLLGLFSLLTGILGEAKSQRPDIDGRGKWLARTGIAVGLGGVVWGMFSRV
jgi:DNA-binding helix-hairpin-helix protein with protein kinase domain